MQASKSSYPSAGKSQIPRKSAVPLCLLVSLCLRADRISRFSRLEFPLMHRFSDSAVSYCTLPVAAQPILPSQRRDAVGTRK